MKHKYNHAILGGTFDHFHAGHKHFIDRALKQAQKLTIGLTTPKMVKDKFLAGSIENYETREKNLIAYLKTKARRNQVSIVPINDIYGTSLKDKDTEAIIVTDAGIQNAKIINQERIKINFPPLEVVIVHPVRGDDGGVISSRRIRAGEIDRNGHSYMKIFADSKKLILTESLRDETRNIPSGQLIKNIGQLKRFVRNLPAGRQGAKFIIAVGDVISSNLIEGGRQADISIIDYRVERTPVERKIISPTLETQNDPGTISQNAVLALKEALNRALSGRRQVIKIIGEEDLLALPAVLLAPLGTIILYGMPASPKTASRGGPGKGAILAEATEEKKAEVVSLVRKFKRSII